MKNNAFRIGLVFIATTLISAHVGQAQIRQTHLYIDDGYGNFEVLSASLGGGTLSFPSGSGGTLLTTGNESQNVVEYGASSVQNTLTNGGNYLFNVGYGTMGTTADAKGAIITADPTLGGHTSVNATALMLSATADATDAAGEKATGLSISAVGNNGASAVAIDATGNVDVNGDVSVSNHAVTITGGNLTVGKVIFVSSEVDAESGNAVAVSGATSFAKISGSPTATVTVTVSSSTTGQVLYLSNSTVQSLKLGTNTVVAGSGRTFIFYSGYGWLPVSS